ncbi:SDR family oxidoreductase [Dactylosporangium sp. NPDC051485]|uniref:SDR family oxidoreductase n=1 Tax=Dactylosporangium sp. NPDC051485 TaxID=3154846 RepID=UPI003431B678
MKIVVFGGTGQIGARLVPLLRAAGHEAVPAARSLGVDALTGEGLDDVLSGAAVTVDVTNTPPASHGELLHFFRTATANQLAAASKAGVGHHLVLSIVGTDKVPGSAHLEAKAAQEQVVEAGGVPFTIVRATQFFEFAEGIAAASTHGDTVRLIPAQVQPIAADDVAAALADLAVSPPRNGTLDLAGPEVIRLDEFVRRYLAATGDPRHVVADPAASLFGGVVDGDALIAGPGGRIAPTRYADWLAAR